MIESKSVEKIFVRLTEVWHLHVGGQTTRTTGEHPFYVYDKAWVPVEKLQVGDWILTDSGEWKKVDEAWNSKEVETVYNLRVADNHAYFVGQDDWGFSVWAHNACFDVGLYASLPSDANFPRHLVPQVRAGTYTWGDEYDPNEAPSIIIPLWMHQQIDHLTGLEFEQHQNADIVVHIRYHLKQFLNFNVPRKKVAELKRLIEATLDVHIGPLPT